HYFSPVSILLYPFRQTSSLRFHRVADRWFSTLSICHLPVRPSPGETMLSEHLHSASKQLGFSTLQIEKVLKLHSPLPAPTTRLRLRPYSALNDPADPAM